MPVFLIRDVLKTNDFFVYFLTFIEDPDIDLIKYLLIYFFNNYVILNIEVFCHGKAPERR